MMNLAGICPGLFRSNREQWKALRREYDWDLTEAAIQYQALFEAASDAILIVSQGGTIIRGNTCCEKLFNISPMDLTGMSIQELFAGNPAPPQGIPPSMAELIAMASPDKSYRFEWPCHCVDGPDFLCEVGLAIIRSGDSDYAQLILRDSSERNRHLEQLRETVAQRDVLLRELHHRVKNNLQFIQSMIALQLNAEEGAVRKALRTIQSRVSALTAAYLAVANQPEDLLVPIESFVHSICEMNREEARRAGIALDIALECGDVHLSLDQAVPLGLILRECIMNAACHGYGGAGAGKVDIGLDSRENVVTLLVRDYGRGLSPEYREGLGLSLASALSRQLGGALSLKSTGDGVLVAATFEQVPACDPEQ